MYQSSILPEEIDKLGLGAFGGKIHVIDGPGAELEYAIRYLGRQKVIGFDTESRPCFSPSQPHYGVSLLQLSGDGEAFLFRIKLVGLDKRLCDIMANPRILKIGAAVNEDIHGLQRYRQFKADGFIDLQKIVWEYGIKDKSVKKMAAIILGVKISKTQQLSNWEADHLSDSQIKYAATDAWVCREMYYRLMDSEKNPLSYEEMHPSSQKPQGEDGGDSDKGAPPKGSSDGKKNARGGKGASSGEASGKDGRNGGLGAMKRRWAFWRRRKQRKSNVKDNTEKGQG